MTHDKLNKKTPQTIAALAMAFALVMAPGLASGAPLAGVPGVFEVGTIDAPGESGDSGGTSSETGPFNSESSSDSTTCIIPWFSGCLFEFTEHEEEQHDHYDSESTYFEWATNDTRNGYYVSVLDGVFWTRVASGDYEHEESSGADAEGSHYDREYYGNNLGFSTESIEESDYFLDNDYASYESVSQTTADAGFDAGAAGASVGLDRQQNGQEGSSTSEESNSSEREEFNLFGIPIHESGASESHSLEEEYQRYWNETSLQSTIFIVNPVDNTTVNIVGLSLSKGDEEESGSSQGSDSSSSYTDVLGFNVVGQEDESDHDSSFYRYNEWLDLTVDVIDGTLQGSVLYEHGNEESESFEHERSVTEVVGLPFGSESTEDQESSSSWRRATIAIDAAEDAGSVVVSHWNEDSESESQTEDDTIVIIPIGSTGEEESEHHSDGYGFGIELGDGEVLWLTGGYENRTDNQRSVSDVTIGGSPLVGSSSESRETVRSIGIMGGIPLADTEAGAGYDESESHEESNVRFGGSDTLGTYESDDSTGYGTGGNVAGDVFNFGLSYREGNKDSGLNLAGTPIGIATEYQEFNAGADGEVRDDNAGQGSLLVYGFSHEESKEDNSIYAGDTTIGRIEQTSTSDEVSFVVLGGLASANAGREFSTTTVYAGEDTEILDASSQQAGAGAEAGPASIDTSVLLLYADIADAFAVGLLLATWCVDPGVPLPMSEVAGVVSMLPGEVAGPAGVALALVPFLMCGALPVPAVALANDCLVADLAQALVFATAGGLTGLLPAPVGSTAQTALALGQDGYNTARPLLDDAGACFWVTVPQEARNPQPLLMALEALQAPPEDDPTAHPLVDNNVQKPVDAWNEILSPTLNEYWPSTGDVWPLYDEAHVTAYGVLDLVFGVDKSLENPDLPTPEEVTGMVPPAP
ncbi:MAG: hypothetical protein ACPGQL_00975 [Thermoplasmatota archaeon]